MTDSIPRPVIPVINGYKKPFARRRLLQTLFSGLRLVNGMKVPKKIYLLQLVLYFFPMIVGIGAGIMFEFSYSTDSSVFIGLAALVVVGVFGFLQFRVMDMKQRQIKSIRLLKNKRLDLSGADEDTYEFKGWSYDTFRFFVKEKRSSTRLLLDLCAGYVLTGLFYAYCSMKRWDDISSIEGATGMGLIAPQLWMAIGWLSYCGAMYSLLVMAPSDLNQATGQDEYSEYTRALYFGLGVAVDMVLFLTVNEADYPTLANICGVYFVLAQAAAFTGLLPRVNVLVFYMLDQTMMWVFGGTPSATFKRGVKQLVVSSVAVAVVSLGSYYMKSYVFGAALAIPLCFLLSRGNMVLGGSKTNISNLTRLEAVFEILFPIVMFTIFFLGYSYVKADSSDNTVFSDVLFENNEYGWKQSLIEVRRSAGMMLIVGCFILVGIGQLARPFVLGVIHSNYKPHAHLEEQKSSKGKRSLLNVGNHVFSLTFLFLIVFESHQDVDSLTKAIVYGVLLTRFIRHNFHLPFRALLEVALAVAVDMALRTSTEITVTPPPTPEFEWQDPGPDIVTDPCLGSAGGLVCLYYRQSLALQLLIVSFLVSRGIEFGNKLRFAYTMVLTTVGFKKQRMRWSIYLLILHILFWPVVVLEILVASLLSAPIYPLLGTPFFLIGSPRNVNFFVHSSQKSISNRPEGVYYEQIFPAIKDRLSETISNGCAGVLGGKPTAGTVLLLRHEKMLVVAHVLEAWRGTLTVQLKGMELQETSCHYAEMMALDTQMEHAMTKKSRVTPRPLSVMEPLGIVPVTTYTAISNRTVGIVDSKEYLAGLPRVFSKVLIYLLYKRLKVEESIPVGWRKIPFSEDQLKNTVSRKFPSVWIRRMKNRAADVNFEDKNGENDKESVARKRMTSAQKKALDKTNRMNELGRLLDEYVYVAAAIFMCVEHPNGSDTVNRTVRHISDVYVGRIPASHEGEYITGTRRGQKVKPNISTFMLKGVKPKPKVAISNASRTRQSRKQLISDIVEREEELAQEKAAPVTAQMERENSQSIRRAKANSIMRAASHSLLSSIGVLPKSASGKMGSGDKSAKELKPESSPVGAALGSTGLLLAGSASVKGAVVQWSSAAKLAAAKSRSKSNLSPSPSLKRMDSLSRVGSQNSLLLFQPGVGGSPGTKAKRTPAILVRSPSKASMASVSSNVSSSEDGKSKPKCQKCHADVRSMWKVCPYCATPLESQLSDDDGDDIDDVLGLLREDSIMSDGSDLIGGGRVETPGNIGLGIAGGQRLDDISPESSPVLKARSPMAADSQTPSPGGGGGAAGELTPQQQAQRALERYLQSEADEKVGGLTRDRSADLGTAAFAGSSSSSSLRRGQSNLSMSYLSSSNRSLLRDASKTIIAQQRLARQVSFSNVAVTQPKGKVLEKKLLEKAEMELLVIKAYRYAVKFTYDQFAAFESLEDDAGLEKCLDEYESDWYIGLDGPMWDENVALSKKNLFCLMTAPPSEASPDPAFNSQVSMHSSDANSAVNTISPTSPTVRMLKMGERQVQLARLNPEAVKGLWAGLGVELYYFTSDDDERFSIQEQPNLLRNLIVQAAQPPLGYPVSTSDLLTVPL